MSSYCQCQLIDESGLFLVVSMYRIIDGVMQSATFFTFQCATGDEITDMNHIAEFADVTTGFYTFEESFSLLIEHIQTVPCTVQTQVTAHDAHIVGHNLSHFPYALSNQHLLLIGHRSLIIPFRYGLIIVILFCMFDGVFGSSIRIDYSLYQGVACQTVATVQTST